MIWIGGSTVYVYYDFFQGYTTYHLSCEHEKRCAAYFWGVLERGFPPNIKAEVKGLRMCKDMRVCLRTTNDFVCYHCQYYCLQSVVFDLLHHAKSVVAETWQDGYMKLKECSELPQLLDRPADYFQRMKGSDRGKYYLHYNFALKCVSYVSYGRSHWLLEGW